MKALKSALKLSADHVDLKDSPSFERRNIGNCFFLRLKLLDKSLVGIQVRRTRKETKFTRRLIWFY